MGRGTWTRARGPPHDGLEQVRARARHRAQAFEHLRARARRLQNGRIRVGATSKRPFLGRAGSYVRRYLGVYVCI